MVSFTKSQKALEMLDYSPALMTDMYEYTMLDACLRDGTANRKCVFEIFTRHLTAWPPLWGGRRPRSYS